MDHDYDFTADVKPRTTGKITKIVVDQDACIGAASCTVVTPEVFKMNDEEIAVITDPNGADDDMLTMSAQSCPVLAIHLYEGDTKVFPEA